MYNLQSKIAVVTGASSKRGLGRAIARRLAQEGASIALIDKYVVAPQDKEEKGNWRGMETLAEEIKSTGRQSLFLTCEISNSLEVDQTVQKIVTELGQIDILVNNAGIHMYSAVKDMSDEVWNKHLDINLTGTFYMSRAVARFMLQRGQEGRIINIASTLGKAGAGNGQSAYCASKFGLIGFTQCLALELASSKILVNAICPTLVDTNLHSDAFQEIGAGKGLSGDEIRGKMNKEFIAKMPVGRLGTADDIANMVAFLASDESSFITGQSLNVNGGFFTAI